MISAALQPALTASGFVWDVGPIIVQLGPFALRWYSLLFLAGFFVGLHLMRRMFRHEGKAEEPLESLLLTTLIGTLIGARLGHCFFYNAEYYLQHPIEVLMLWKGGLASHGGMLGILVAIWVYTRRDRAIPYVWFLDRLVIPTALGGAFIRLGNLFNSEILGRAAEVPWAIVFARATNLDAVARHPVMLYESAAYLAIFVLLHRLYWRHNAGSRRGLLLGLFLILVFSARFTLEFFKVRQADFAQDWSLSVGQWLSILPIVFGALLIVRARHASEGTPQGRGG